MDDIQATGDEQASVPDSKTVSVTDVLRAVFMPPHETSDTAQPEPAAFAVPSWLPAFPTRSKKQAKSIETRRPAVDYSLDPVLPAASNDITHTIAVGMGVPVAILIAYMALSADSDQGGGFVATLLYVLSGFVWLGLLLFEFAVPDGGLLKRGPIISGSIGYREDTSRSLSDWLLQRGPYLLALAGMSALVYVFTAQNTFTLPAVMLWVLSVIVAMIVMADQDVNQLAADLRSNLARRPALDTNRIKRFVLPVLGLILILSVALFYRAYRLPTLPAEMTSDHVEKVLDAYRVSKGQFSVFFTGNGGREAAQFYLIAALSRLFNTGFTFTSLKLVALLESLAIFPLILLLGREMLDRKTGFLAASLLAVSWWHVAITRLSLRIILTPLVFIPILITLVRGIRTGSRRSWLWAGFWMGVGVYSYQALRMTPLVAAAAFIISVAGPVADSVRSRLMGAPNHDMATDVALMAVYRQLQNLLAAGLVAFVMFVPMLRVWHDYPEQLWSRVVNRTTNNEVSISGSPANIFFDNYRDALLMFTKNGDVAWVTAVPGEPMLDKITGALFLLGLAAWIVRIRLRKEPADVFLLVAALIMLLPSALAIAFPIENPSATRASGAIPVVFLVAAWPLSLVFDRWRSLIGRRIGSTLAVLLSAALLAIAALLNFHTYFVEFDASYHASALNPADVAREIRAEIGEDTPMDGTWLQGWPFWHDFRAIGIEAGDPDFANAIINVQDLRARLNDMPESFALRPLVFIVHPDDAEALAVLEETFPDGAATFYQRDSTKHSFYLYIVR